MELLITQWFIPIACALLAGWRTLVARNAVKESSTVKSALDVLTTVIEMLDNKSAKDNVAKMSNNTTEGIAIDESIGRLDLDSIREYIRTRKAQL